MSDKFAVPAPDMGVVVVFYQINECIDLIQRYLGGDFKTLVAPRDMPPIHNQKLLSGIWKLLAKKMAAHWVSGNECDAEIVKTYRGKPAFAAGSGFERVHFNASHTRQSGVLALSLSGAVGIDIESRDRQVEWQSLGERYFPKQDMEELIELAPEHKCSDFIRRWTRLEAILKWRGHGVSELLNSEKREALRTDYTSCHEVLIHPELWGHLATEAELLKKIDQYTICGSDLIHVSGDQSRDLTQCPRP